MAPISINYTSGTTGRPKGVIYTHRGYLDSLGVVIHSWQDENSVYLWTLSMFHCNGWCTTWAVTAIGGTHVCLREVRGEGSGRRPGRPPKPHWTDQAVIAAFLIRTGQLAWPLLEQPDLPSP